MEQIKQYINTNTDLIKFCDSLAKASFISVDTEFLRTKTYYPKLCLIQIATETHAVIIDALAGLDLEILRPIFQNPRIIKIFHSAKQDLEILYLLYNELPVNIFDTQIAACFYSIGNSISYEELVKDILGVELDKSHSLSDWTKRPLSDKQIEYAYSDVTYLNKIYPKLIDILSSNKRLSWVIEENDALNKIENFITNKDKAWLKLKETQGIQINLVIKRLAAWREKKAQIADLPRNHYLPEICLYELAKYLPITLAELRKINHFKKISDEEGLELIEVIQEALNDQITQDLSTELETAPKINIELLSKLKSLLKIQADKYKLPTNVIATSQELKDLCAGKHAESKVLKGWRYKVFGAVILENHLT